MNIKTKITTVAAAGTLALAGIASPTMSTAAPVDHQATTGKTQQANQGVELYRINNSALLLKLGKGVTFNAANNTLTQNGHTEKLPTTAKDKDGAEVKLAYVQTKKGIEIRAISTSPYAVRSTGECLSGIGGDALIYGGTLGGSGAVACSVIPGAGTLACGLGGAIVGGVGGALRGAANHCFS